MKNTKKFLSTGLALAITLFAAVQITAMAPKINPLTAMGRTVNPHLSPYQEELLRINIEQQKQFLDPNSKRFVGDDEHLRKLVEEKIKIYEDMYYGNQPARI